MTMRGRVVVSVWKDGQDVTWYREFREFAVSSLLDLIFSLGILPSAYNKSVTFFFTFFDISLPKCWISEE